MSIKKGIYSASMSVLNVDLSLDVNSTVEHAEKLIEEGCHGSVIGGSTGMSQLISSNEKKRLIEKISTSKFKDNFIFSEIFIYFSFLVSWLIILIFIDGNLKNGLILLYFFIVSILTAPLMQEYFDPLILIIIFTFFNSKIFISYKNAMILFIYLSIFLVGTNIYYFNLLN